MQQRKEEILKKYFSQEPKLLVPRHRQPDVLTQLHVCEHVLSESMYIKDLQAAVQNNP